MATPHHEIGVRLTNITLPELKIVNPLQPDQYTRKLCLIFLNGRWHIEATELGMALGLKSPRNLRAPSFLERFSADQYVVLDHGEATTKYFRYFEATNGFAHPIDAYRLHNRTQKAFWTLSAVKSYCEASTSEASPVLWAGISKGVSHLNAETEAPQSEVSFEEEEDEDTEGHLSVLDSLLLKRPESVTPYEALQTLLTQLQTLEDPQLRDLAINAALLVLPEEWEPKLKPLRPKSTPKIPVVEVGTREQVVHPPLLFQEDQYYTPANIAALAGYSHRDTIKVIHEICRERGVDPRNLKQRKYPFTRLVKGWVNDGKKETTFTHYRGNFAKLVAEGLRNNPKFKPVKQEFSPGVLEPFDS